MDTLFMFMAQYRRAFVDLEEVSEEWFNLCPKKAKELAARQQFPIPVVRSSDSRKAKYKVAITDLAAYYEKQCESARRDWESAQR